MIEAGPDLLAALEDMTTVFNTKREDIEPLAAMVAIEQARAAIAKAKGETQS
jgi:hypothetical protein